MRDAVTPEALLALKLLSDYAIEIIQSKADSDGYWGSDDESEELIDGLINNSILFDDSTSTRSIDHFKSFPVSLEVINFCYEWHVPLVVELDFSYNNPSNCSHNDHLDFLRKYTTDKLSDNIRKTLLSKLDALRNSSERKSLLSANRDIWIFRMLDSLARTAIINLKQKEERQKENSLDEAGFPSTDFDLGNEESNDSNFLLRLKSFISLPAEEQSPQFSYEVDKALSHYLTALLNAEISFSCQLIPWKKQLEMVNRELEKQSGGRNEFTIDPSCFAARVNAYEKAISSNYRPMECLMLLEKRGDVAINRIERTEYGDGNIVFHIVFLANDWLNKNVRPKKDTNSQSEPSIFHFGKSITDCDAHYIWKDGDKENGHKFARGGKRRYIWKYCREICDQGFRSQEDINKYVTDYCGRNEKVTTDDMKGFLPVISLYSAIPLNELKDNYIIFKEGSGIEVRKVP